MAENHEYYCENHSNLILYGDQRQTTTAGQSIDNLFQEDIVKAATPGTDLSAIHLVAAANAFQTRVVSIYPNGGLVQGIILPRGIVKRTIYILWSHYTMTRKDEATGNLVPIPLDQFIPNHFVPLLPKDKTKTFDTKLFSPPLFPFIFSPKANELTVNANRFKLH